MDGGCGTHGARRTRKGHADLHAASAEDADARAEDAAAATPPAAAEAWAALRDCSLVVGLHPDSATESIVDFALATGKPFAVVPCCVCAVDFPGRNVTSFDGLVRHLVAKAPERIRVCTLDGFAGRNLCVYAHGAGEAGRAAADAAATCSECVS